MSGCDSVNRNILSRVRKVARDGADVTSGGRQLHTWGPATENARLPTVERWTGGWTRQSLQKERSHRRLGSNASERAMVRRCTAVEDLVSRTTANSNRSWCSITQTRHVAALSLSNCQLSAAEPFQLLPPPRSATHCLTVSFQYQFSIISFRHRLKTFRFHRSFSC